MPAARAAVGHNSGDPATGDRRSRPPPPISLFSLPPSLNLSLSQYSVTAAHLCAGSMVGHHGRSDLHRMHPRCRWRPSTAVQARRGGKHATRPEPRIRPVEHPSRSSPLSRSFLLSLMSDTPPNAASGAGGVADQGSGPAKWRARRRARTKIKSAASHAPLSLSVTKTGKYVKKLRAGMKEGVTLHFLLISHATSRIKVHGIPSTTSRA